MGGCGTHYYDNVKKQKIDLMIEKLTSSGAEVTGNNPWDIDTKQSGVTLRAEYTEPTLRSALTVTDRAWYAPCFKIWERLDSLMHDIQGSPGAEPA